jgi:WD repeat-containing protein mio
MPQNPSPSPLVQLGTSEAVSSAAWFINESPRLVAGMGFKWIRLFDLRMNLSSSTVEPSSTSPSIVIATKSVLGLTADPFDSRRFASFSESNICIWDIRKVRSVNFF